MVPVNGCAREGIVAVLLREENLFESKQGRYISRARSIRLNRSTWVPSRMRGKTVPKEPKTLGEHLRRRRAQLGLHYKEAARILGVSTVTLSRWELDKSYPLYSHQNRIAQYLGYDPFPEIEARLWQNNESRGVAYFPAQNDGFVARCIRKFRSERKLTAEACGQLLGVDKKSIQNWAKGRCQPSRKLRFRIANRIGFDVLGSE